MIFRRPVPRRTILELDMEPGLMEYAPPEPLAQAVHRGRLSLRTVVEALERGAADPRVRALIARTGPAEPALAQAEEIRDAVLAFRAAGKPALFFADSFGEAGPGHGAYLLATGFDEIWIQPSGTLGLTGIMAPVPFARRAMAKLGLVPRLDRRHEYKSMPNLFTEEGFTEPHREELSALVDSLYDRLIDATAEARGLHRDRFAATMGRGPLSAAEALEAGLVDQLAYRNDAFETLRARVGQKARFLYVSEYLRRAGSPYRGRGGTVAVIYGVGTVQRGSSRFHPLRGSILGSESVALAFREAVADRRVRAIVFRVDSPGGSYVASDTVWREVLRARKAGKPVVASMGYVAASGGYFVCMGADRIVAHPTTITGSIGVLGGKVLTRELWERIGIRWDDVHAGDHAAMWSTIHDYSPGEWERLQLWLDAVYGDFIEKAAEGRGMSTDALHEVARGRAWTGRDALRLGLVDELGGFPTALRRAREAAGIPPDARIRLQEFPRRPPLAYRLLGARRPASQPDAVLAVLAGIAAAPDPLAGIARVLGGDASDVLRIPDHLLVR